jgi:hypothetical protein
MALTTLFTRTAESNTLVDEGVVSNNGSFSDHDTHAVVNEDALPNRSTRMNFNARQKPGKLRNKPGNEGNP